DVLAFLDGVAIAAAVRRDAQRQQLVEFINGRYVKIGVLVAQQRDNLGSRIRLDCIIYTRIGEELLLFIKPPGHSRCIDHDKRRFLRLREGLYPSEGLSVVIVFHLGEFSAHWRIGLLRAWLVRVGENRALL